MSKSQQAPSAELETARTLATTSGNTFHAKVATYLREHGWSVLISPYYVDNATGSAREIDLLCERSVYSPTNRGVVYRQQLFVECKYITSPTVLWFDDRDHERTADWLRTHTPFKSSERSVYRHRYIKGGSRVAKLFHSGKNPDPIYVGLAQSLGALIQRRSGKPLEPRDNVNVEMTARYPVIVCSDGPGFYEVDLDGDPNNVRPVTLPFQLEVDYAFNNSAGRGIAEYFLIDIVRFNQLDLFLKSLRIEADEALLRLGD